MLRILSVLVYMLCLTFDAQQTPLKPIYTNVFIENLLWTSDSQSVIFESPDPNTHSNQDTIWRMLNTNTGKISRAEIVGFPSPNGKYRVIPGKIDATRLTTETILVDVENNVEFVFTLSGVGAGKGTEYYNIQWSENSEAFVVSASGRSSGPYYFHYVDNFTGNLESLRVQDIGSTKIDDNVYTTREVYDLSYDGSSVLLKTDYSPKNTSTNIASLIIWSPSELYETVSTSSENIIAATLHNKSSKITGVSIKGLVHIDLKSKEETILQSDIASTRFRQAKFSPDGNKLALVEVLPMNQEGIHIIDLTEQDNSQ